MCDDVLIPSGDCIFEEGSAILSAAVSVAALVCVVPPVSSRDAKSALVCVGCSGAGAGWEDWTGAGAEAEAGWEGWSGADGAG